jgi:hypothetical protein
LSAGISVTAAIFRRDGDAMTDAGAMSDMVALKADRIIVRTDRRGRIRGRNVSRYHRLRRHRGKRDFRKETS